MQDNPITMAQVGALNDIVLIKDTKKVAKESFARLFYKNLKQSLSLSSSLKPLLLSVGFGAFTYIYGAGLVLSLVAGGVGGLCSILEQAHKEYKANSKEYWRQTTDQQLTRDVQQISKESDAKVRRHKAELEKIKADTEKIVKDRKDAEKNIEEREAPRKKLLEQKMCLQELIAQGEKDRLERLKEEEEDAKDDERFQKLKQKLDNLLQKDDPATNPGLEEFKNVLKAKNLVPNDDAANPGWGGFVSKKNNDEPALGWRE